MRGMRSSWLLVLVACGGLDGDPASGRFELVGTTPGHSQGLILASSRVIEVRPQQTGDADLFLSIAMVIQLRGTAAGGGFCEKGRFGEVEAIPAEHAACEWTYAGIAAHIPHDESGAAGQGYVVRDRFDEATYRLLVVDDTIDEAGTVRVVFDVEPIAQPAR
jgi:hypothetical protein